MRRVGLAIGVWSPVLLVGFFTEAGCGGDRDQRASKTALTLVEADGLARGLLADSSASLQCYLL